VLRDRRVAWGWGGAALVILLVVAIAHSHPPRPLVDAGFEHGLRGWNTSGAGDAVPTVASDRVHEGSAAAKIVLTGSQSRSELILAHPRSGAIFDFHEGDTYYYGFSFFIDSMIWGRPGAHNILWQLHQRGTGSTGSPPVALALISYRGRRGLWLQSRAGRDRFLRPLALHRWYDVTVRFHVSSRRTGSYDVYLNGRRVDRDAGVDTLVPGYAACMIQTGLYRNGGVLHGTSEIRLDAVRLGRTFAQVQPR
jgi:hypothetical protein